MYILHVHKFAFIFANRKIRNENLLKITIKSIQLLISLKNSNIYKYINA